MRAAHSVVASMLLLSACGSPSPSDAPTDTGTVDDTPAATPTVAFFTAPTLADAPVAANRAFWADVIVVRATGLPRGAVTLRATSRLRDGTYTSWARFDVGDSGAIDTAKDAPVEGSWSGADPDGITWSMIKATSSPGEPLDQWALRVELEINDLRVAQATLSRYLVGSNVKRIAVAEDGIVGALYVADDGKKHPTVLTFGGSEGGTYASESSAAYLSALGYAALGVGYFGAAGLPETLERIPLEYFERAMKWLDARPEADATKLAVMGGSRGGELALLLGATFPRVRAVVAQMPSAYAWGAPQYDGTEIASWTYGGVDLPFLPSIVSSPKVITDADGKKLRAYDVTFLASIEAATPAQREQAIARVERTNGPVLMIAGKDDRLWPACAMSQPALDRARAHGRKDDELLCLEGAGHSIPIPGSPTIGSHRAFHPVTREWLALGGTPGGTARAARAADTRLRAFLHNVLR